MKLGKLAEWISTTVSETLTSMAFPSKHWRRIRTNNPLERIMREIRRRTRCAGAFQDGESALWPPPGSDTSPARAGRRAAITELKEEPHAAA